MYAMHSLFCSAEIKVSFAIGLNSTFSLEALSTLKDIVLSVLQGKFSISYLCNRNSMNAMNNEIFYAESVITSLKASCCFPLVITCRFHSVTACLPTIIIVSITVLSTSQYSTCSVITACASSRLGQARRAQLFGQHLLDVDNQTIAG